LEKEYGKEYLDVCCEGKDRKIEKTAQSEALQYLP
jgi:hypothetical protein